MEYLVLCVLALVGGGIFYGKRRRAGAAKATAKRSGQDRPVTYEEDERDICARYGALPCDGKQCGRVRCSPVERLFCRDVLQPVVGRHFFCGQYEMRLSSEKYRIDFAVNTTDGRRLALELDGFRTHVREMDPEQFGRQLRRQNELVLAGWQVLRFSFRQLTRETETCRQIVRRALTASRPPVFTPQPPFRAQESSPAARRAVPARGGSARRGMQEAAGIDSGARGSPSPTRTLRKRRGSVCHMPY